MEYNQLNKESLTNYSNLSLIDFNFHLERLKKLKENAVAIFQRDTDQGIEEFIRIFIELENLMNKLQLLENNHKISPEFFEFKKTIYSNLANGYRKKGNYELSVKYDEAIISQDKMFDKSYARLIYNYIKIGDLKRADELKNKMDEIFPETTLEKYRNNLFIDLKNALEKQNLDLMRISKGMFKKVSSDKKKKNTNVKKKSETNSFHGIDKENINNISIADHKIKNEKNNSLRSILSKVAKYTFLGTIFITGMCFMIKKMRNKYY